MHDRLDLQETLCKILGSRNVYFQPPESIKIQYPAIIYSLSNVRTMYAEDKLYFKKKSYTVTVIDKNPDSTIPNKLSKLQYCSFDRFYISNGLNHFIFTLYY